jgi:hypothetical protein
LTVHLWQREAIYTISVGCDPSTATRRTTPSSSEGKHLMLMLAVEGKEYRHIAFGAESGSAAEAELDVVVNAWIGTFTL